MKLSKYLQAQQNDDWITEALNRASLLNAPQESWTEPDLKVSPSSASMECPLAVQFHLLGHRTAVNPKSEDRMDNGSDAHKRITHRFQRAGILGLDGEDAPIRVPLGPGIWSGRPDIFALREGEDKVVIVEIKTMNSFKFRKCPPQNPDLQEMSKDLYKYVPDYVIQLVQYHEMYTRFGHDYFEFDFSDVVAFYFENTDTQEYVVRYFTIPDRLREIAFENAKKALEYSANGEMIPFPFAQDSLECNRCYRKTVCDKFRNEDPEVVDLIEEALKKVELKDE